MDDKYDGDLFLNLQRLSIEEPELVEVFIDDDGEIEFEVEFNFFFDNLERIFGFYLDKKIRIAVSLSGMARNFEQCCENTLEFFT